MNKVFTNSLATANDNDIDRKCFSFGFSLDSNTGEEASNKKKSKSKPKKKKKSTITKSDLQEATYDSKEIDCIQVALDQTILEAVPFECVPKVAVVLASDSTTLPEEIVPEIIHTDIENDEGLKSKKKKKNKKKLAKIIVLDKDDDMDFLEKQIALLATTTPSAVTKSTSNMKLGPGIKNGNRSQNNKDINNSNSSFSFKSHKDPELSEEQRSLFRYGNGKNLVAIGPPKHKGDPIWKLSPPPGLKIPDSINLIDYQSSGLSSSNVDGMNDSDVDKDRRNRSLNMNGDKIVPPLLSHNSPFSFGFGF